MVFDTEWMALLGGIGEKRRGELIGVSAPRLSGIGRREDPFLTFLKYLHVA
jgi:hypothetical protein